MTRLPAATFGGRKEQPLARGLLDYFPAALAAVSEVSVQGAAQHNTLMLDGTPTHQRGLSADHPDALLRHLVDRGEFDNDGIRHSAKMAWRALALLQEEIEAENGAMEKARAAELNEGLQSNLRVEASNKTPLRFVEGGWQAGDLISKGPRNYSITAEDAEVMNRIGGNWDYERLSNAKLLSGSQWTPEEQADIGRIAKIFSPRQPVDNDI